MSLIERRVWKRFVAISLPFFRSDVRWRAIAMLSLLIVLLFSVSGLNVLNSFVNSYFMTSVANREERDVYFYAAVYIAVFAGATVVAVLYRFTEERLGLLWRDWLTRHILDRYLADHSYYRLTTRDDIDNPDQRISEDIRTFTATTLSFVLILLNSTITLVAFAGILWAITPWLFASAVLYAAFGTLMTLLLGHRLVGLNILQLKKEADLRYRLIRVREHAGSIALMRGEKREKVRIHQRLSAAVENLKVIIAVNRNLACFTVGYNYLVQILPVMIVAPLYIRKEIEFGVVTQSVIAFAHVLGAFSLIVVEFQRISSFAAVISRLGALWEAINEEGHEMEIDVENAGDDAEIGYRNLTLVTPKDRRELLRDLTLSIPRGRRVLVLGVNEAAKNALFEATAGLWPTGSGTIVRPPLEQVMFLPRQPYLLPGTLRDQFREVMPSHEIDEERLGEILSDLALETVVEHLGGLDADRNWPAVLSIREQQLVAFARLLLANPPFALLDEATSALEDERVAGLYALLSETSITYISLENSRRLLDRHDWLLELSHDGTWQAGPVDAVTPSAS